MEASEASEASEVTERSLTFLKAVPEGARPAHGPGFLIQGHAGVPEPVFTAGVKGSVLIGQTVVAQAGEVHLSRGGRAGGCQTIKNTSSQQFTIPTFSANETDAALSSVVM